MGIGNYLIEGVSGAGKTSVAEALERLGYQVVHGDRVLAYQGDPETGMRLDAAAQRDDLAFLHGHHLWDVAMVRAIAGEQSEAATFFCGGSRNFAKFIDLFDQVFVLEVDAETLKVRLARRGGDEPGGLAEERAFILARQAAGDDVPREAITIDASQPLEAVVADILDHCRQPIPAPVRRRE